jgi:L-lactate utilization protein LutC
MGIFSKIKDAIFGKPAAAAPAPAPTAAAQPTSTATTAPEPQDAPPMVTPMSEVDVEARLTEMAAGRDSNWRTSIVDLMKLVGMESSLAERKELATELGYTGALDGSAEMNIWLHKEVMRHLAANGGKVPDSLLD